MRLAPVLLSHPSVKTRRTLLVALALALAATPAVATDSDTAVKPMQADDGELARPLPDASIVPVRRAVESLQRLRLRPGADGLDMTETTRARPRATDE